MNQPQDVDDLRRQLRALGYLDAGVDRFLLAPAQEARRPAALAVRSSLRVGLLGGLLLGPAAAIGVGGRVPGLVSGVRDAFVVALYLGVVFFVALAGTAFIASLAARLLVRASGARFGRRARLATDAIGWTIALGCLTYLTFWWRNANAGFGWSAPLWTTFALVVAAGISLLIGHAIRVTALAVLAAARPAAELPRVPSKSWRLIVVGGVLALVGAATVLTLTAAPDVTPPEFPPLTIVGGGNRVRVIALDGVDASVFADAHWIDERTVFGATYRLAPQDTSDPARAWTTIATGEPPSVHGVRGLETRRVAGLRGTFTNSSAVGRTIGAATDLVRLTRPSIASGQERQSLTVWEVAEKAGLRTAVVNWWATWPATGEPVVISDRAVLRLEQRGNLDAEISPASLYPLLQSKWAEIRTAAADAAGRAFGSVADTATAAVLRRSAQLDATIVGLANSIPPPKRDLDIVYLPGLDIAQHALLASDQQGALLPSRATERIAALRTYYEFLRAVLGDWLRPGDHDVIMIVTEPGRVETAAEGTLTVYEHVPQFDVKPGVRSGGTANVEDVAPTILNLLGVPLSRELPGKPVGGIPGSGSGRYVPTYGHPNATPPPRTGKPLDQEMIDRLRSLGYVK